MDTNARAYNGVTHDKVTRWLSPVTSWYQLGIRMGVPSHKLKKIELDYPNDVDRRKHEVVSHWICNDREASWNSLADILEECEQKVLAENLRKECNDSYTKESSGRHQKTPTPARQHSWPIKAVALPNYSAAGDKGIETRAKLCKHAELQPQEHVQKGVDREKGTAHPSPLAYLMEKVDKILHGGVDTMYDHDEDKHGKWYLNVREKLRTPVGEQDALKVGLDILIVLFQHLEIGQTHGELQEIQKHLQQRYVEISVLGRHNLGKSTALNALLSSKLLPTSRKNNSAVRVVIEHKPLEDHISEDGSSLKTSEGRLLASGRDQIREKIEALNNGVRDDAHQDDEIPTGITLYAHIPLVRNSPRHHKVVLVDTPGFDEAGFRRIHSIAKGSLRSNNACVLVLSYSQLGDCRDTKILNTLTKLDSAIIEDQRLVIAVTQHDSYYAGDQNEEMDLEETTEYVHDGFQMNGYSIQKNQIVPFSGRWALLARELRDCPSDKRLLVAAQSALLAYKQREGGGEDIYTQVRNMTAGDVAEQLEAASNLKALEKRVQELVVACDSVLLSSSKSKIGRFVRQALADLASECLKIRNTTLQEEITKKDHICKCLEQIESEREELRRTTDGPGTEVHDTLLEHVKQDLQAAHDEVKQTIQTEVARFKQQCMRKCKEIRTYETQMFKQDLNEFVDNNFTKSLQATLLQARFDRAQSVCYQFRWKYLPDALDKLKAAVKNLQLPGETAVNSEAAECRDIGPEKSGMLTCVQLLSGNILRLRHLVDESHFEEPQVEKWNTLQWLRVLIRILFLTRIEGDPLSIKEAWHRSYPQITMSEEDVVTALQSLERDLLSHAHYSESDLEKKLMEHFYGVYKSEAEKELEEFKEKYDSKIKQQHQAIEKIQQKIETLQIEMQDLQNIREFLQELYNTYLMH